MAKLKKYNLKGEELASVDLNDTFLKEEANPQMIKDYLVAIRNNKRQWSANTKTRKEVKHTTKKPYRQKGTGNARHGDLVGPQFRGGGVAHGPKPKDIHTRINKKERRAAIRALITALVQNDKVILLDETKLDAPRTKDVAFFLNQLGLTGNRVLFLGEGINETVEVENEKKTVSVKCTKHHNFSKSVRNIPRVEFKLAKNVSGHDVALANDLILTEGALNELIEWLTY